MAVKSWNVGDVLTAADLDAWAVPLAGYKAGDLSRTNNTISSDPDVTIPLAANAVYRVEYDLSFACAASAGTVNFQFQFTVPSGATGFTLKTYWISAASQQTALPDPWTTNRVPYVDSTRDWGVQGSGIIFTSSTAASLVLQWAQGTTNATATILRKGSILIANRVG